MQDLGSQLGVPPADRRPWGFPRPAATVLRPLLGDARADRTLRLAKAGLAVGLGLYEGFTILTNERYAPTITGLNKRHPWIGLAAKAWGDWHFGQP